MEGIPSLPGVSPRVLRTHNPNAEVSEGHAAEGSVAMEFIPSRRMLIRVSRPALGSQFEIILGGQDVEALEAVGYAALDRVNWLEQQLSHFFPDSEICQINCRAFSEPVTVSPSLFQLLLRLRRWSEL